MATDGVEIMDAYPDTDVSSTPRTEPPPDEARRPWGRQGGGDEPHVLEPDHPLMKRFQTALKSHLDRQNARLGEELLEITAILRSRHKEREEMGVSLFNMQQDVARQQKILEAHRDTLASLSELRQEIETAVAGAKTTHKDEVEKLNSAKKKEAELQAEVECVSRKERQLQLWAQDMEAELCVSQRISEKTRLEKKQLAAEKRKQDMLLLRISSEVDRLEGELGTLFARCVATEAERNVLCQTVADAQADLEAMGTEQRRLLRAWGGVVVALGIRDRAYNTVKRELTSVLERYQTLCFEIDGLRRSSAQEQERNESLSEILARVGMEASGLDRLIRTATARRTVLETEIAALAAMMEQTDLDLALASSECARRTQENKLLQKQVELLSNEKVALEDAIVTCLQDQETNDKTASHLGKMLRGLQDKSREMEVSVVVVENQVSAVMLTCVRQEGILEGNRLLLEELKKELANQEREADAMAIEIAQSRVKISKRQSNIDLLNKKMESFLNKTGGEEMSPAEIKILGLQKTIEETEESAEKLQSFWLRQQTHAVTYCQQRNQQLTDIDLIRKQVMILEQKNLKIEYDIRRHIKQETRVARSVTTLMQQLEQLNLRLGEARGNKEHLDRDNQLHQGEYMGLLKDAEMACLRLESEIKQLEDDKTTMSEKLIETQREQLAWDCKLQLALETRRTMDQERSSGGEVGSMRAEIHRMQVRYSQLRKAQDKLIHDLDHCVYRRDAIVDVAEARDKRSSKGAVNTRTHFRRKLDDTRNKIKQTNTESKSIERELTTLEAKQDELMSSLGDKEHQLKAVQEMAAQVDVQLEDAILHKQRNLEQLIRRQRKVRQYMEIKVYRHRLLFKTEASLDAETQRQRGINSDLITVCEALLSDFPSLRFPVTKILNTLRLAPS